MTLPVTEGSFPTPWHPVLSEWFKRRYGEPTSVQQREWNAIQNGESVLISSPPTWPHPSACNGPDFASPCARGTRRPKRGAMLKNPPDILITTPESLYILLTSVRG